MGDLIFCADLYFLVFRHQALAQQQEGDLCFVKNKRKSAALELLPGFLALVVGKLCLNKANYIINSRVHLLTFYLFILWLIVKRFPKHIYLEQGLLISNRQERKFYSYQGSGAGAPEFILEPELN